MDADAKLREALKLALDVFDVRRKRPPRKGSGVQVMQAADDPTRTPLFHQ